MARKTKAIPTEQALSETDSGYDARQRTIDNDFRSPFQMLNLTAKDCAAHLATLGMSNETIASDAKLFNDTIKKVIDEHGFPDTNRKVDHVLALAFDFVSTRMRDPSHTQNYWPLIACRCALDTVYEHQKKEGFAVNAAILNVALFAQGMMNIAWKPKRMRSLEQLAANQYAHMDQQQATNRVLNNVNKTLAPLAKKGDKFKPGRDSGALSPLAQAVKTYLEKNRQASANDVWNALSENPPDNHVFMDTPRLGKYVENATTGKTIAEWGAFANHVSRQRPKEDSKQIIV